MWVSHIEPPTHCVWLSVLSPLQLSPGHAGVLGFLLMAVHDRGFLSCRQGNVLWQGLVTLSFRALLGGAYLAVNAQEWGLPLTLVPS